MRCLEAGDTQLFGDDRDNDWRGKVKVSALRSLELRGSYGGGLLCLKVRAFGTLYLADTDQVPTEGVGVRGNRQVQGRVPLS